MKLPKKIYVKQVVDGHLVYLEATDDPSSFVEVGFAVECGEYQLVRPGVVIEAEVKVRVK